MARSMRLRSASFRDDWGDRGVLSGESTSAASFLSGVATGSGTRPGGASSESLPSKNISISASRTKDTLLGGDGGGLCWPGRLNLA